MTLENAAAVAGQRRICYINFASHLLNAYNPNLLYPGCPHHWSDEEWGRFFDMIAGFGFNTFEFWLDPMLFCRQGLESEAGREFTRQMSVIIEHGLTRNVQVEMLCTLTTVGPSWHTYCPHVPEEWDEVLYLWEQWMARLPGLGIVGIFPGDPGGCSRHGCTAETFIDGAVTVAEIIKRRLLVAEIELGTWGPPFFGWGIIEGPPGWQGEYIPAYQSTAKKFDKRRADSAMAYLLRRMPDLPPEFPRTA